VFRFYIGSQDIVTGAVLVQENGGKENIIAYLDRRLLEAKNRYVFIEQYACTIFRHYLLFSICLQQPILRD
jgi:hypothetical protein